MGRQTGIVATEEDERSLLAFMQSVAEFAPYNPPLRRRRLELTPASKAQTCSLPSFVTAAADKAAADQAAAALKAAQDQVARWTAATSAAKQAKQ